MDYYSSNTIGGAAGASLGREPRPSLAFSCIGASEAHDSNIMIRLVNEEIDPARLLRHVHTTGAGAVVLFLGTTREVTEGRETESLDYACYPAMAEKQLLQLEQQARRRWPILHCAIVHRLGHLLPGETSVAIAVSSAHRHDAFHAGQWLIDAIKQVVPIWKQENWADGSSQWVHPGIEPPTKPRILP